MRVGSTWSTVSRTALLGSVLLSSGWVVPAEVLGQTIGGAGYVDAPLPTRYRSAIIQARKVLLDVIEEKGVTGISAAVAVDGGIVWSEGFGYADVENRVLVSPVSKFRSGSIAKSITGTGLALLVERGMIDLDAPVRQYVPEWPEKHATITLRQLAGHQGGIRHYNTPSISYHQDKHYTDLVDAIEWFKDDSLLFEPGSRYGYSSYGYNLLGMAMQRAAEEPFADFIKKNVFEPLGMRSSVADDSESIIPYRVRFYERTGGIRSFRKIPSRYEGPEGILMNTPGGDNSYKTPSGGFLTTPEDLLRLCMGILEPKPGFLKPETQRLLLTPMRTASGEETGYALGWNIGTDERGYHTVSHGGGGSGVSNSLVCYPDQRVEVAVMANFTDAEYGNVSSRIAWLFMESR